MLFIIVVVVLIIVIYNMSKNKTGLFAKEGKCEKCGQNLDAFNRIELIDGKLLCKDCYSRIPKYAFDYIRGNWNFDDYLKYMEYIEYSNKSLKPKFNSTSSYGAIYIDEDNGLFFISHKFFGGEEIEEDMPVFEFKNLKDFDFSFKPEKVKEGILGVKVKGEVSFIFETDYPSFGEKVLVEMSASAKAKKSFIGSNITYELPEEMREFGTKFAVSYFRYRQVYESNGTGSVTNEKELSTALSLFMFDTLDEVSQEQLKEQRNILIKAFHPDQDGKIDPKYAAKINNAYSIIEKALKDRE